MNDEINKKDRELMEKAINWWNSLIQDEVENLLRKNFLPGKSPLSVSEWEIVGMFIQEDERANVREVGVKGERQDNNFDVFGHPRAQVFVNSEYVGSPTTNIQKPSWIRRVINYWTRPLEPRLYHYFLSSFVIIIALFGAMYFTQKENDSSYENPANWDSVWTTMHGKRLVFKVYNPYHKKKLIIKMDERVVGEGTDSVQEVIHSYYLLPDTTKIVKP